MTNTGANTDVLQINKSFKLKYVLSLYRAFPQQMHKVFWDNYQDPSLMSYRKTYILEQLLVSDSLKFQKRAQVGKVIFKEADRFDL